MGNLNAIPAGEAFGLSGLRRKRLGQRTSGSLAAGEGLSGQDLMAHFAASN